MSPIRREWLRHVLRKAPWRTQMQATALAALGLVVSIIIGALYLAQATGTVTAYRDLKAREQYLERLRQENDRLRSNIAAAQTVPSLAQRARDLGFVPATNEQILYLVVEGYRPPEPPSVVPVAAEPLPQYTETLNDWLAQQWDTLMTQLNLRPASSEAPHD